MIEIPKPKQRLTFKKIRLGTKIILLIYKVILYKVNELYKLIERYNFIFLIWLIT